MRQVSQHRQRALVRHDPHVCVQLLLGQSVQRRQQALPQLGLRALGLDRRDALDGLDHRGLMGTVTLLEGLQARSDPTRRDPNDHGVHGRHQSHQAKTQRTVDRQQGRRDDPPCDLGEQRRPLRTRNARIPRTPSRRRLTSPVWRA